MDERMIQRWRGGLSPFSGDCLRTDDLISVEELRALLSVIVLDLKNEYSDQPLYTFDDWHEHAERSTVAHVELTAGQWYSLRLDYYERLGSASIKLYWSSRSQAWAPQPVNSPANIVRAVFPRARRANNKIPIQTISGAFGYSHVLAPTFLPRRS